MILSLQKFLPVMLELEQSLAQELGSDTRKEALQGLVNAILSALRSANVIAAE